MSVWSFGLLVAAEEDIQEGPANARKKCCQTCGARRSSPVSSEWLRERIVDFAEYGEPFSCHDGIDPRDEPDCADWTWRPDGIAVRPDGRPADLCAGWLAHHRRIRTSASDASAPEATR